MKVKKIIAATITMILVSGSSTGYLPVSSSSSYEVCAVEEATVAVKDEAAPQTELLEEEGSETFEENVLGTIRQAAIEANIVTALIQIAQRLKMMVSLFPPK